MNDCSVITESLENKGLFNVPYLITKRRKEFDRA